MKTRPDKDKISSVSQDVINIIALYLSYNNELANLRKTSTKMNQLIENTAAGKLAREANNLQPSNFEIWITRNHNLVKVSISSILSCINLGLQFAIEGAISPFACTMIPINFIGIFNEDSILASKFSFFTQNIQNRIDQVNQIRTELEQPVSEKIIL